MLPSFVFNLEFSITQKQKETRRDERKKEREIYRVSWKPGEDNFTVLHRRSTAISRIVRSLLSHREFDVHREILTILRGSSRCTGSEDRRENASGTEPELVADYSGPTYEVIPRNKFLVRHCGSYSGTRVKKVAAVQILPSIRDGRIVPPL